MRVIIEQDPDAVGRRAAAFVAELVRRKPQCVLGFATGETPGLAYRQMVRMHRDEGLDFSHATAFVLDEFVGLGPMHPQSHRAFMQQHLFDQINLNPSRIYVPDGRALDFEGFCRLYEQRIVDVGGIDLQILDVGSDGHIAFNEPGSSLGSRTRLKTLARETIGDKASLFGGDENVPRLVVTMGVGTILESRRCLLVAIGAGKAGVLRDAIEGPVTAQLTASALQLHREVIVIVDEAAASQLARRQYYAEVERAQSLLETGQQRALGSLTS